MTMESTINLSFEGSEDARSLFAEAGASKGDRLRVVLEVTLQETNEEGVTLYPEVIESVDSIAKAEPEGDVEGPQTDTSDAVDDEVPGMVALMDKKKTEDDG